MVNESVARWTVQGAWTVSWSRVSAWTRWVVVGRWPDGRVEAVDESVVRV